MRDDEQFLLDIVEAAETISASVDGISIEVFRSDILLQRAVLFSFVIIGEASNKLSTSITEFHPEVDWSSMIGFRNIIVHAIFR